MLATIGIIIDIAVIAVILVFSIIGLKKGLLKSVLSLFSWFVCIMVSVFTAKYVAGWINGVYDFSSLIGKGISKNLIDMNAFFNQSINVFEAGGKDALINAIPKDINGLLAQLIKVVFSNTNVDMSSTATIGSIVGSSLGHICMVIISGVLIFILLKIIVALLSKLFDNIERTKVLGGLNKLLGLILGFVKASIIIIVLNCILVGLTLVPTFNKMINPLIQENTYVEKVIYNQTDKMFGKYVIEGDTVKNWVETLWNAR